MMLRRSSAVATLFCAGLCCIGCGQGHPDPVYEPAPPDMSALIATYDSPTGTFDPEFMPEVRSAARDIARRIRTIGVGDLLLGLVHDATVALVGAGAERTDGGFFQARRACSGWEQQLDPTALGGNGRVELTMAYSQWGLDAVAWGEVIACEYLAQERRILLYGLDSTVAGAVRLSFGRPVTFNRVAERPVLIDLDATVEVDDSPEPADFDFRIDQTSLALELRIAVADGDVIVQISEDEPTGVRAANGDFPLDQ